MARVGLIEIIARLEKLDGPDREVDLDVAIATGQVCDEVAKYGPYLRRIEKRRCDPVTSSLDAAIGLVDKVLPADETADHEKSEIRLQMGDFGCNAVISRDTFTCERSFFGIGKTPPIALLIAALRALEGSRSDV
jgi:hypothetical protein